MGLVLVDLLKAQGMQVLPIEPSSVPVGDVFQRLFKRPARRPVQALPGFRDVELEVVSLVWVVARLQLPTGALPPGLAQVLNDPLHGAGVFVFGAKVPAFGKALRLCCALFVQFFGQEQVARQGLQSPPPMTLPARAVAMAMPASFRNDLR